jgi:hypothetical protein
MLRRQMMVVLSSANFANLHLLRLLQSQGSNIICQEKVGKELVFVEEYPLMLKQQPTKQCTKNNMPSHQLIMQFQM